MTILLFLFPFIVPYLTHVVVYYETDVKVVTLMSKW